MKYLIHFTDNIKKLGNILTTQSLKLRYCQEEFYLANRKISAAVHPMVCFSEYDLRELDLKTITYGRYGIAFHKKWAIEHNIEPVLYIQAKSTAASALAALLRARQNNKDLPKHLRLPIMTLKCFTKNAIGFNSCLGIDEYLFHQENEWRYVPKKKDIGGGLISQNRSTYIKDKNRYNKKLEPYCIRFGLDDIAMVYVNSEKDQLLLSKISQLSMNKIKVSDWKTK